MQIYLEQIYELFAGRPHPFSFVDLWFFSLCDLSLIPSIHVDPLPSLLWPSPVRELLSFYEFPGDDIAIVK